MKTRPDIAVRSAARDDLPDIRRLHGTSWRDAYRGMLSAAWLAEGLDAWMAARWSDLPAGDIVLLAGSTAGPLGFVSLSPNHPEGPYLDNLHVTPEARGQGIGRCLMRAGITALAGQGRTRMWLGVMARNRDARAIYKRFGGREAARFDEDFEGEVVPMIKVVWDHLPEL